MSSKQAAPVPFTPPHLTGHLHERGWSGRLRRPGTWLFRGVWQPWRRCRAKRVLQGEVSQWGPMSPPPPCRLGCFKAGGWGAAVGTFPKSFPVALGLATSAPHPPTACPPLFQPPRVRGSLSRNICGDRTKLARVAGDRGSTVSACGERRHRPRLG